MAIFNSYVRLPEGNIQIIRSPKGNSMTVTVLVILGIIHRRFLTCSVPGHVGKDTGCYNLHITFDKLCLDVFKETHSETYQL